MNNDKTKTINPLFSISFRPFFLAAAALACLNPISWAFNFLGKFHFSLVNTSTMFWHGHEMIFGFAGALIAGFIFTASANWTNSEPYQGKILMLLLAAWMIERVSYVLPVGDFLFLLLNNLFFPTVVVLLFLKLKNFPKQRNVFIPLLIGITIAKVLNSYGHVFSDIDLELMGRDLATGLIRLIILLIAGRVLPFFTRKRLPEVMIQVPGFINALSLISILLLAIPFPDVIPSFVRAGIFLLAILANMTRQAMWLPHKTIKVPILFVLHVGVFFIQLSLIYEFMGFFVEGLDAAKASLHLLMAGGLGVVGMGIMTRVSLGHTGRDIKAGKIVQLIYVCITLGAFIRAFAILVLPDFYMVSLYLSSFLWCGGFLLFLIHFKNVLLYARPDGKAY